MPATTTGSVLTGIRLGLDLNSRLVYRENLASKLIKRTEPSPEILAEIKSNKERMKAQQAEAEKTNEEIAASNKLDNKDMNLPNITSLDVELAKKVRGFVEVDIAQNTDKGMTVFGYYGDKRVDSLKDYLSLLNGYIVEKSGFSTSSSSTQPSPAPETTPPATGASPTAPSAAITLTGIPGPSEPVATADSNWTDPVGRSGQNRIFFPNVAPLTRETAAVVYKQVSNMVQSQDISDSVIHARNGLAGTYSVETYMSWLAQRAATNVVA